MKLIATLTIVTVLLVAASITYGADAPQMVKINDQPTRVAAIKTVLDQYRSGLDSWNGTFKIDKIYSKEMLAWIEADSKKKTGLASWACQLTVDVSKTGTTKIDLGIIDKDGNVIPTKTGDESDPELKELLGLVREMIFATEVGSSWDYYAGVKTTETEEEVWARISATGWTSYQLSKPMGYLPTRIEYGTFGSIPSDFTTFGDYRKTNGRWTSWKMVETLLVPDQSSVGIVTTVTAQKLDFVPKPITP